MEKDKPLAIEANLVPARQKPSVYPEPFASLMAGRTKQALGDFFGIKNFGINLTRLAPGARSALLHRHKLQEELIYILEGNPTLLTDINEIQMHPGMCAGFIPEGRPHQLVNRTTSDVLYLEVGDRTKGDEVYYPLDDLVAQSCADGQWAFTHKNGTPY